MLKKIIFLVVLILAAIALIRFWSPEDAWLCRNNQWVKHGNPEGLAPATGCGEELVGSDRDEHGCIGSAGYSWCQAKEKCLRIFEEDCLSAESIRELLALKYGRPASEVAVEVLEENTRHARGKVSFAPFDGPGGIFLAAKSGDEWQLVFDGNGSIDCGGIRQNYQFPEEMLAGFCD